MDYAGCENYYIKEDALLLVLAKIGVDSWYQMHKKEQVQKITKEEINKLFVYLYQEKYVIWEDGAVRLLEPMNTLAYIIKHSSTCLTVRNEEVFYFCYYYDHRVLVLEKGKQDSDKIRFTIWEEDQFINHLWDIEIFPAEELEEEEELFSGQEYVKSIIDLSTKNLSEQKSKLVVSETGIFTHITVNEGKKENKVLYSKKYCVDIIKKWLQMEG